MENNVERQSVSRLRAVISTNECSLLLPFRPIDSGYTSMVTTPHREGSVSFSRSYSSHFQRKYIYISSGGMVASALNFASATLGASILALPYAVYNSGFLLAVFALLTCVLATVYSVYVLARVMEITGMRTYEDMALCLFGPCFEKITDCTIVFFCAGVAVVYVVVIGDIIDSTMKAVHLDVYTSRTTVLILFWLFIMLPLCLVRSMNSLRYSSVVGAVSTMALTAAICMHAFNNGAKLTVLPLVKVERKTVSSFNTFVFSFCCQPVVSRVYSEMRESTPPRVTTAAALSMGLCSYIYIIAGVFGAADFAEKTEPNIMHNYTNDLETPYITLAFLAMTITVTIAFPMTIIPTRDSLLMFFGYSTEDGGGWVLVAVAVGLAFLALVLSIYVPNMRFLFDVLGGVLGSLVSFVFPALFALRCGFWDPDRVGLLHSFASVGLLLLGVVSCVLGVCGLLGMV